MIVGKYEITAQFLEWAEENFHMLQNAKVFGQGSPSDKVKLASYSDGGANHTYGFSCFDGEEGIISLRNPGRNPQEISFTLSSGTVKSVKKHVDNVTYTIITNEPIAAGEITVSTGCKTK